MSETRVEKGMILLWEKTFAKESGIPTRYQLVTVASVRHGAKSSSVKLVAHVEYASMVATATFPDGVIREPFKLFVPSQRDLAGIWPRITGDRQEEKTESPA